jgi:sortase (surface protein transpeptidase)
MSEQKNNINNLHLRSRVKKYDTYYSRKVGSLNQSLNTAHQYPTDSNTQQNNQESFNQKGVISADKPTSSEKVYQNKHNNSLSQQPDPNQTLSSIPKSNPHSGSDRKPFNQRRLRNGNNVALESVATAQIYDNEIYPDNGNTVYGSGKLKKTLLQKFTYGFALLILVFSAFVSVQSFVTNNQAKDQIATLGDTVNRDEQGISEGTGNEPSEEPIPESVVRNYQVSNPEDPRFLRIPSLGVFSRVKNLGVTAEGAVDAPRNIYDTGWYNGSARPGSSFGSSLILGHVSGWTGPGVFKKINELPVGGEFEIEKGTGEIIKYSVTRSEKLPLDQIDMGKILSTEVTGKHDLKLMTCSGKYNPATETFEDRFIVYAKKI